MPSYSFTASILAALATASMYSGDGPVIYDSDDMPIVEPRLEYEFTIENKTVQTVQKTKPIIVEGANLPTEDDTGLRAGSCVEAFETAPKYICYIGLLNNGDTLTFVIDEFDNVPWLPSQESVESASKRLLAIDNVLSQKFFGGSDRPSTCIKTFKKVQDTLIEVSAVTFGCSSTTIDLEEDVELTKSSWSVRATYRRTFTSQSAA